MLIQWMSFTSNGTKNYYVNYTTTPCFATTQTNKDESTLIQNATPTSFTLKNNGGTPSIQWVIVIGY